MENKKDLNQKNNVLISDNQRIERREFIKLSAAGIAALGLSLNGCMNLTDEELAHLIPLDKNLSPEWIKSLTSRGMAEIFTSEKDELKYIGMPIGGVGCGQLYISGDGRLWLWDIFQSNYEREGPAEEKWRLDQFTMGGVYPNPRSSRNNSIHDVTQGTAIKATIEGESQILALNDADFDEVTFRGEYPMAKVTYKKEGLPLTVEMTAFSPYIPLNLKDSAIPAVILRYQVTNTGQKDMEITLGSWLENKVSPTAKTTTGKRHNKVLKKKGCQTVFMTADGDKALSAKKGWGNMALSLLGNQGKTYSNSQLKNKNYQETLFQDEIVTNASASFEERLVGSVSTSLVLVPGSSETIDIIVSWYFPYYNEINPEGEHLNKVKDITTLNRYYKQHFTDANAVVDYIVSDFDRLIGTTQKWNETWYDSTLPYWFLDRSFISMNCLASQTSHIFDNGRFWGWEGVDCCQGTCTHVWQYAQGMSRLFPSLERDLRQRVDYNIAYSKGAISYRGENLDHYTGEVFAIDGQLGTIIRVYREHQMSTDDTFLKPLWSKVKASMQFIIDQDKDGDGLIEGKQPHTLDAAWYGPMGWISGLYLAGVATCEQMALEMDDIAFAKQCATIVTKGRKSMVDKLFNGEYFIHLNPNNEHINTNIGCHIDQVLGQSFAHQVNLPGVLSEKETQSALASLWKYNFAPDAGQYVVDHTVIKGDRKYVLPGEAGTLMCTWPKGGDDTAVPGMDERPADSPYWEGPGAYFDECMNGFEYQVASHMVWEGMLTEGLTIMKAVHERYGAAKRNPYDEVECSSHYSRSMAAYGVFLAACGYQYHGPKGYLGFAPRINPEDFKSAFTTAESWGTFIQKREVNLQQNILEIAYGKLKLSTLSFDTGKSITAATMHINDTATDIVLKDTSNTQHINFEPIILNAGDALTITFTYA